MKSTITVILDVRGSYISIAHKFEASVCTLQDFHTFQFTSLEDYILIN
jgi:hypothetical protein